MNGCIIQNMVRYIIQEEAVRIWIYRFAAFLIHRQLQRVIKAVEDTINVRNVKKGHPGMEWCILQITETVITAAFPAAGLKEPSI